MTINLCGSARSDRRDRSAVAVSRASLLAVAAVAATVVVFAGAAQAAPPVLLGTADRFAVLGGSTVTNTGPSVIDGDVGLAPGAAVTGFPPGIVTGGTMHVTDAVALQAKQDLVTAYNTAAGQSTSATVSADLAGVTLAPGTYTSTSAMGLTGDLTLDAHGDAGAVFVFQAGSTLTVGAGSRVLLRGGAQACNVFWQVGSSATIGTASAFTGNILALTSISMTTNATLLGRALARNGAVTLDTNRITAARCAGPTTSPGTTTPGGTGSGGTPAGGDTPTAGSPAGAGSTATPGSPAAKKAALAKRQKAARALKARKAAARAKLRRANRLRRQRELERRRRADDLPPTRGRPGRRPQTPGRFTG